jgi:membrane-bound lytic murein transglycosylase D
MVRRARIAGVLAALGGAGLLVFVATRPSVRGAVARYFEPVSAVPAAVPRADASSPAPAPAKVVRGDEARELRTLADLEAKALAGAGAAPPTDDRSALLPATEKLPMAAPLQGLRLPPFVTRRPLLVERLLGALRADDAARQALVAAHRRCGRFRAAMTAAFERNKVPLDLLAAAYVQSACLPDAEAPGRTGLWGLTLPQAKAFELVVVPGYDERRSPYRGSDEFAEFLALAKQRLGAWELALYAHAVGYGKASAELEALPPDDFATLIAEKRLDPRGTRWAAEVLAVAIALANPEPFGLDHVAQEESVLSKDLEIPPSTPLAVVAQAADTTVPALRGLNPEYTGDYVPSTGLLMTMRVPGSGYARAKEMLLALLYSTSDAVRNAPRAGSGASTASAPAAAPAGVVGVSADGSRYYRVKEGDTLPTIAAQFGCTVDDIAKDNTLRKEDPLKPGKLLVLPAAPGAPAPAPAPSSPRTPRVGGKKSR